MADRNRELVPDNWSLVRERALTKGLCSEGWCSEYSDGTITFPGHVPLLHNSVKSGDVNYGTNTSHVSYFRYG